MSKIRIKIRPGKPTEFKVEGIPGGDCRVVSRPYEDAIGGKVTSSTNTAEADQPAVVSEALRQQEGY